MYLISSSTTPVSRYTLTPSPSLSRLLSIFYTHSLSLPLPLPSSSTAEFRRLWVMLNFDMIGSPNGMRGVYDGDSAPEEINVMSAAVQRMFGSWITLLHSLSLTIFPLTISSLNPYIAIDAIYPTPLFLSLPLTFPFFPLFYKPSHV